MEPSVKGVRQGSYSAIALGSADLDMEYTTEHLLLKPEGSSTSNRGFEGTNPPDERTGLAVEAPAYVLAELEAMAGVKETEDHRADHRSRSAKRGPLPLAFWRERSAQMCWILASGKIAGILCRLDLATSGALPLEGSA